MNLLAGTVFKKMATKYRYFCTILCIIYKIGKANRAHRHKMHVWKNCA